MITTTIIQMMTTPTINLQVILHPKIRDFFFFLTFQTSFTYSEENIKISTKEITILTAVTTLNSWISTSEDNNRHASSFACAENSPPHELQCNATHVWNAGPPRQDQDDTALFGFIYVLHYPSGNTGFGDCIPNTGRKS